jgi:hypothetical protein
MGGYLKRVWIIGLLLAAINLEARAEVLSQTALLVRCYAHLTGQRISFSDPLLLSVKAGKLTALEACNSMLDQSVLGGGGLQANPTVQSRQIMTHFYEFYRSWFAVQRFEDGVPMPEFTTMTKDVYDSTIGGLMLTYMLLQPGQHYAGIVTQTNGVYAMRSLAANPYPAGGAYSRVIQWSVNSKFGPVLYQTGFKYCPTDSPGKQNINCTVPMQFWNPNTSPITIGELIGLTPYGVQPDGTSGPGPEPVSAVVPMSFINPYDAAFPFSLALLGADEQNFAGTFDIRQSLGRGAGLIGTREYLMLNIGHDFNFKSDGGIGVNRRWAKNVMSDLLCRDVPLLRQEDVNSPTFVTQDPNAAPFHHSPNCLRCHAAMDQMAYTTRNLRWVQANESDPGMPFTDGWNTAHLSTYTPIGDGGYYWSPTPVPNFHLQVPRGRVYFRSFTGQLIDQPAAAMSDVGAILSGTDDLYACAAKRHFQLFTGINVTLYDMGDGANSDLNRNMSAKDYEYRLFIAQLGEHLHQSGSLIAMIKEIMASKYYGLSDYGKGGAP